MRVPFDHTPRSCVRPYRASAVVAALLTAALVAAGAVPASSSTRASTPSLRLCAVGGGCGTLTYNDPGTGWRESAPGISDIAERSYLYGAWAGFTLLLDRGKIDNNFLNAYCPDVLEGIKRQAGPGQGWSWDWNQGGVKDACVAELERRFHLSTLSVVLHSQDLAGLVRDEAVVGGLINVTGSYGISCRNCGKSSQQQYLDLEISHTGTEQALKTASRSWSPGQANASFSVSTLPSGPALTTRALPIPSPQHFPIRVKQRHKRGGVTLLVSSPALRYAGRGNKSVPIVMRVGRNAAAAKQLILTRSTSTWVGLRLFPVCGADRVSGRCRPRGPITVEIWPDKAERLGAELDSVVARKVVRLR